MRAVTIWLKPGQAVSYCPYCHSHNVRINEDGSYCSCNACEGNFIVRHRKAEPQQVARSISSERVWQLRQELLAKGGC